MNVYEAILKRRSIRKFKQDRINSEILMKLVNAGRLAPQGANMQCLKYCIISSGELTDKVFVHTNWAAYIKPNGNPKEDEKPTAYIAIICDKGIKKAGWDVDAGAAGENIILAATAEGLGSCWLGAINREQISGILKLDEKYYLHSLIALGYPAESPIIEDIKDISQDAEMGAAIDTEIDDTKNTAGGMNNDGIKYYKDENGTLHVPKRRLSDVLIDCKNILILGVIISLLSIITGCEHIEDTNGENTNLTTITMEKLAGKTISIRSSGFSKNITRKNITILSQHADIDVDSLVMKGGLASGIDNIMATELKQGQKLRIDCGASVESGNLGIIMISPDNEVLYNFKIGEEDSCEIIAEKKGIYFIRMGAESFKGEISLKRTID